MFIAGALQFGVNAADHGDAPGVRVDTRLDINDVYAFQSPSQSGNVVFIMTVSPAGADSVAEHISIRGRNYDFFVNTNADPDYEFAFNFRFGDPGPGGTSSRCVSSAESRTQRIFDVVAGTNG